MTKREAKKVALGTAATILEETCQTEVFMNAAYSDYEIDKLLAALVEIADELQRRSER